MCPQFPLIHVNLVKPVEWEEPVIHIPENETDTNGGWVIFKILANPKPSSSKLKINEKVIETGGDKVDVFQASVFEETNQVVSQYLLSIFMKFISIVLSRMDMTFTK